jgi:mRNA export factor
VNPHQLLHPINAVSFNPKNSFWFMTAGADGFMHFWDYSAKNKIKMLNYGDVPICVAKVNPSGNMVAYGLGNDWHLGAEGNKWETKLGVHIITDAEIKYK